MTNKFQESAKRLENSSATTDAVVAETRLHFDTLVEVHADELRRSAERHENEKKQMRRHYRMIIVALAILVSLCAITLGAVLYGSAL